HLIGKSVWKRFVMSNECGSPLAVRVNSKESVTIHERDNNLQICVKVKDVGQVIEDVVAQLIKDLLDGVCTWTDTEKKYTIVTNTVANHAEKLTLLLTPVTNIVTTLNLARFLKDTAPQVEPPRESKPSNAQMTTSWLTKTLIYLILPRQIWLSMLHHLQSPIPREKTAKGSNKKIKGKAEYLASKVNIVKHNYQGLCYNCNQPGHCFANCKMSKRVTPFQANTVNDNVDIIAMVSNVIAMVGSNNKDWWVDIVATRHVYVDKSMFCSFKAIHNEEKLYMGNSTTAHIKGEGDVILKMISGKKLKLTNILTSVAFVLVFILFFLRDMDGGSFKNNRDIRMLGREGNDPIPRIEDLLGALCQEPTRPASQETPFGNEASNGPKVLLRHDEKKAKNKKNERVKRTNMWKSNGSSN
nr:hypothetical protein [Tanacetum cinerariifolium]